VLRALETQLATPDMVAEFVREYLAERRRLAAEASANREGTEQRIGDLRLGIERIVDKIVAGTDTEVMVERMKAMEAERKELEASLAELPADDPIRLHPGTAERYRKIVATLRDHLAARQDDALKAAARDLISHIEIGRRNDKGPAPVTVFGPFAEILLSSQGLPPMAGNVGCGDTQHPLPTMRLRA
jgi:site-specific DNA recombinase